MVIRLFFAFSLMPLPDERPQKSAQSRPQRSASGVEREIADHRGFGMHMLSFERKCVIIRWEVPRFFGIARKRPNASGGKRENNAPRFKHLFEAQEKSDRRRSAIQIRG